MENFDMYEKRLDQYLLSFAFDTKSSIQSAQTFRLALFQCRNHFYGRFLRCRLIAKKKIVELLQDTLCQLEESQINVLKHGLKPLAVSSSQKLSQNILTLHLSFINTLKKQKLQQAQQLQKHSIQTISKKILKQLTPLLFYYFIFRQYQKRKKSISSLIICSYNKKGSEKKIMPNDDKNRRQLVQNQENQSLLCSIQAQFSKMTYSLIFQKYLEQEESLLIDSIQVCKICSQQVKLKNFQIHIKSCCKKAKIQFQLNNLEDERKKLYEEIQKFQKTIMFQTTEPKQKDLNILRILFMIKQAFLQNKKATCLKRNTTHISKADPLQQIKMQIQMLDQKSQEDLQLLDKLIVNAQKIIGAKKKLLIVGMNSKTNVNSSKYSSASIHQLQQSICNAKIATASIKTKKSLFASKKLTAQKKQISTKSKTLSKSKSKSKRKSKQLQKPPSISSFEDTFSSNSIEDCIMRDQQDNIQKNVKNVKNLALKQYQSMNIQENLAKSRKTDDKNKQNKQNNFKSLKIFCSLEDLDQEVIGLDDFQILKFLGKGAYGQVYLVRRKKTKDLYALKHIVYQNAKTQHQIKLIRKEHQIFKKIAGDHLIKAPFAFSESYGHFFVLQFMPGGDLSKILSNQVYLEEQQAKFYLAQIVLALQYLHECDIIHRDLKPQNIVLDKNGHIKLTDFGLSDIKIQDKLVKVKQKFDINTKKCHLERNARRIALVNRTDIAKIIGTPDYIAPQIINQTSINNYSIDWWSLGVMAYQMLVGCRPFSAMTIDDILKNILDCKIQWPQIGRQDQMMSPEAYDLIQKLLDKNFQKRIGSQSCQQIKNHPFFNGIDWDNIKNQTPPIIPIAQLSYLKKYQYLPQDQKLRNQIMSAHKNQKNKAKNCIGLQNFVRYDVLLEQTCQSIQQKINKSRIKFKKLQSLGQFIQQQQINNKPRILQEQNKNIENKRPLSLVQEKKVGRKVNFSCKEAQT